MSSSPLSSGSPRLQTRENPFACFEAFVCLKPITTKDAKENVISTAEVTWSYPYREKRILERYGSLDKMAFPTFSPTTPVAPISGDGTFIFVMTLEGKARDSALQQRSSQSRIDQSVQQSPLQSSPHQQSLASPSRSQQQQQQQQQQKQQEERSHEYSDLSEDEADCRRRAAQREFKQLYGHCITTVYGEVSVFLSTYPWVGFFRSLLHYYRGNGPEAGRALLKELYRVPTPMEPGGSFNVRFGRSVITRPLDAPHLRGIDTDPALLLKVFTDAQLCEIVSAMLLVETIIICGPDFGVVSKVVVALRSLVSCVDSQCWVYAPVLPRAMLGLLASPVPGVFGLVDDFLKDPRETADVFESMYSTVFVQLKSVALPQSSSSLSSSSAADTNLIFSSRRESAGTSPTTAEGSIVNRSTLVNAFGRRRRQRPLEENPPYDGSVFCSDVTFHGTSSIPLPRASSVFSSTLRRGLAALRTHHPTTTRATAGANQQLARRSADLLMLFVRYYAAHLGHVGAPNFTSERAVEQHKALNGRRGDFADEAAFFERFYASQTCVQLSEELGQIINRSNAWTTDVFGNMVVQLNPSWYGDELRKYRQEELAPLGAKSAWEMWREGRGPSHALLLSCCCSSDAALQGGSEDDSETEHGPSRNISAATGVSASSSRSQGGLFLTPDGQGQGGPAAPEVIISREDLASHGYVGRQSGTFSATSRGTARSGSIAMEMEMDERNGSRSGE